MPSSSETSLSAPVPCAPGTGPHLPEHVRALLAQAEGSADRSRVGDAMLRAFDVAVCLMLLPAALLVGGITALLIFLDSPGPVFYRSVRVGRNGETFEMLKFRKMLRAATGLPLTMANDHRFTPSGRFLALTKLDELPQLWNVLRGDMRLVGPRPEDPMFVARYPEQYREILSVLPGITGPAALEYASEAHLLAMHTDPLLCYQEQIMPRKLELDAAYVRTRSLRGDLRFLARTCAIPLVRLLHRGRSTRWLRLELAGLVLAVSLLVVAFTAAGASGS